MKKNGKRILILAVVLIVIGVIATVTGQFDGIEGVIGVTEISWSVVIRLALMIVFLCLLENVIIVVLQAIKKTNSGRLRTFSTVIESLAKYAFALIGICWGLTIIGVNVSTVFAGVGIVALILGFGAESLVADLVTGVFILFENQYNVGDIIEVDGFRGTVVEIGIRTISIMDLGGNIKIINNSDLKNIVNRSNQISVAVCDIAVSYGTDLEQVEEIFPKMLDDIQKKHQDLFEKGIVYVGVEQLADYAVILRFKAEVKEADVYNGRRVLNRELKVAFDRAKIEIPFPQLEVLTK